MIISLRIPVARHLLQPTRRHQTGRLWDAFLFGLASDGVYRAFHVAMEAVSSYLAVSPLPGSTGRFIFCGTFHRSPGVRVTNHPALRSTDFPPRHIQCLSDHTPTPFRYSTRKSKKCKEKS